LASRAPILQIALFATRSKDTLDSARPASVLSDSIDYHIRLDLVPASLTVMASRSVIPACVRLAAPLDFFALLERCDTVLLVWVQAGGRSSAIQILRWLDLVVVQYHFFLEHDEEAICRRTRCLLALLAAGNEGLARLAPGSVARDVAERLGTRALAANLFSTRITRWLVELACESILAGKASVSAIRLFLSVCDARRTHLAISCDLLTHSRNCAFLQ